MGGHWEREPSWADKHHKHNSIWGAVYEFYTVDGKVTYKPVSDYYYNNNNLPACDLGAPPYMMCFPGVMFHICSNLKFWTTTKLHYKNRQQSDMKLNRSSPWWCAMQSAPVKVKYTLGCSNFETNCFCWCGSVCSSHKTFAKRNFLFVTK